jgi:hypothetical protein
LLKQEQLLEGIKQAIALKKLLKRNYEKHLASASKKIADD